jgi:putative Ca2+/H+ antiporter (TMEM165/GDT1 family)
VPETRSEKAGYRTKKAKGYQSSCSTKEKPRITMATHRLFPILVSLFLILPATVLASKVADDWFETLDLNHDGSLDKDEYEQGISKFNAFLEQPLDVSSVTSSFFSLPEISLVGFWKAFTSSVAMILATEIGDKTFFIAAVLSMKHSRSAVFGGAILALIIMTILSTAMGLVLPRFLSKQYTHWFGGALFLYFGFKLIYDSTKMEAGRASDELEEVEEEFRQQSSKKEDEEEGGITKQNSRANSLNKRWHQVALQALALTFVAEWGDRSQIATIALAAAKNPIGVTIGGCLGHSMCTGLAVIGGRMLAAKIEEKTVSMWGGVVFLLFGVHSVFFEE